MHFIPILSTLRRHKIAAGLIVLEIALTCAIVCNAVFLIRDRLERMNQPSGVAEDELVRLVVTGIGKDADPRALTATDVDAMRAIPGVKAVSVADMVPFGGSSWNSSASSVADDPQPPINAATYGGGRDLVKAFGLNIVAGRDFNADEFVDFEALESGKSTPPSILISRDVAERLYPGKDPLGKPIYIWGTAPQTVVGVYDQLARPNRNRPGEENYSAILPTTMSYDQAGNYVLRVDPSRKDEILDEAEAAIYKVAPNRIVLHKDTFADVRRTHFQDDRAMAWLLVGVCIALLVITALGIVGLASFWVQQRTRQIGIRRALGANRRQILSYFQMENFILATLGIVIGMGLAYGINLWLIDAYHVARLPATFLPFGAILLWVLGQIAVLGPALRAAAVPPAVATRTV